MLSDLRPLASDIFAGLRRLSLDGPGVTREALGARETAAHEFIARIAAAEGLDVARDGMCNLVISLPGREKSAPFLATGSHLDSVPRGGNYDGAAGVAAGLLALAHLRRLGVAPLRTIKAYALRGEESAWFGTSWIGSRGLFGLITESDLARPRCDNGRSLRDCLAELGADMGKISRGERFLDPANVGAFIEVHIEQGPVLESREIPLGVVTGIYASMRHMAVVCRGAAAHAGTTPRALRHDAVVAVADYVLRLDRCWAEWLERGKQLVLTHGVLGTDPAEHAVSRVPGYARFSIEIRSDDEATLRGFHEVIRAEANAVARERGVTFEFDAPLHNRGAPMHDGLIEVLEKCCKHAEIDHMRIASGAGHDSALFAQAGIPTGMLFIRNAHGSHNPDEHMEMDDFLAATFVLTEALLALADSR
ncbi:MAG: Zn-dependent hydrolase [Betaproteobacteria bacterium]